MYRWRCLFTSLTVVFAFLTSPAAMAQPDRPPVTVQSEVEGWYDIVFPILARAPAMDGDRKWGTLIKVGGMFDGRTVEWGLVIPDEWEEAKMTPPPPMKSWASVVLFGRIGITSDHLVRSLAGVYQLPAAGLVARDEVELDAISIFADPRPIGSKPIHLKMFVHGKKAEDYAEFYLNVDLSAGTVKMKEKDPEYRAAMLRAFTGDRQ